MRKVTPFLMFNDRLEEALDLYTSIFPDSKVRNVARNGKDGPVASAEFTVGGQEFMAYDGGPHFSFSGGFSLFVDCRDQAEVDGYWDKLVKAGSKPTQCGWINDPFGLSWQIVPRRFMELFQDKDPKKVTAVLDAMMTMQKLDVAAPERAYGKAQGGQGRSLTRPLRHPRTGNTIPTPGLEPGLKQGRIAPGGAIPGSAPG